MNNYKKLSIIVPIYNVELYIRRCLDSLVNQTFKNLEIILVDDGSPDDSGKICDEYASQDNRIKVIHKQNGGVSSARNAGLAVVTGDYVCFVDPDDWLALDAYEKLLKHFEQDIDAVFFGFYIYRSSNDIEAFSPKKVGVVNREEALEQMAKRNYGYEAVTWNKIVKTCITKEHTFDTELVVTQDAAFWVSCIADCNSVYLDHKPYYFYLMRNSSAIHRNDLKQFYCTWKAWKIFSDICIQYPLALRWSSLEECCHRISLLAAYYVYGMTKEFNDLRHNSKLPLYILFQPNLHRFMRRVQAILLHLLLTFNAPKKFVNTILCKHKY